MDGMPRDVAFPRPEKYELEGKKEDIVRFEEVPLSTVGVRYAGLGVTNKAVYYEEVDISNDAGQSEEISNEVRHDEKGILNKAID